VVSFPVRKLSRKLAVSKYFSTELIVVAPRVDGAIPVLCAEYSVLRVGGDPFAHQVSLAAACGAGHELASYWGVTAPRLRRLDSASNSS
jgi:hypothetical protein